LKNYPEKSGIDFHCGIESCFFRQKPIYKRSIPDEMIAPLAPALPPSGAVALAIVPKQVMRHYRNAQGWVREGNATEGSTRRIRRILR
jgi:hypothetical protein